ncbi:H-NS family nucleoid-associated regulatory protein [Comamonas testosteroni]|uniref:H-NS histone family protein n=1 Tax=Comamonas testosteroni TaxID=285 RepID=UPI0009B8EB0D|nr:H-NS histone family protein [Comamonas testosteroni]
MTATKSSYKELLAQRAELEQQIAAARKAELAGAVQEIRKLIDAFGLTESDIFSATKHKRSSAGSPVAPKYRDPSTGQTWTGRGKPPTWIKDKDRSLFEIS